MSRLKDVNLKTNKLSASSLQKRYKDYLQNVEEIFNIIFENYSFRIKD